jgi:hypothetical protein
MENDPMEIGMPWRIVDLTIEGDSFIARFTDGRSEIELSADLSVRWQEDRIFEGTARPGTGTNTVGASVLVSLARWVKAELDVDQLRIAGAIRTSGAGPGRRPRPIAF